MIDEEMRHKTHHGSSRFLIWLNFPPNLVSSGATFITSKETCVYGFDKQVKHKKVKFKLFNVMFIVTFNIRGFVYHEIVLEGQTAQKVNYLAILKLRISSTNVCVLNNNLGISYDDNADIEKQ